MRINKQRDTLVEAVEEVGCDLIAAIAAIHRKMVAPYPDGSRSNMINAETDVLPRLISIRDRLQEAMNAIQGDRCHTFGTDDVTRLCSSR